MTAVQAPQRPAPARTPRRRVSCFLHRHPRLRLGGAAVGAAALARRGLPRLAGDHVRVGVLEHGRLHRRRSTRPSRSRTSGRSSPTRSTARWRSAPSSSPCSVTVIDMVLALPDGVLHGQGRPRRAVRCAAGRRGAHAAVGELPRQGVRLARDARSRAASSTGRWSRSGCTARASAYRRRHRACRTCGCRTWSCRSTPALERLPDSLLEASATSAPRRGRTFRAVVLPLILPARRRRLDLHVLAARSATTSWCRSSAARPSCSPT